MTLPLHLLPFEAYFFHRSIFQFVWYSTPFLSDCPLNPIKVKEEKKMHSIQVRIKGKGDFLIEKPEKSLSKDSLKQ